jgi:hypothetical protein
VIANPRGYPTRERGVSENPDWNPALVIDIEPRLTPGMRIWVMEILASVIAVYLIAKVGWPVVKFIGVVVALGMIMHGCK